MEHIGSAHDDAQLELLKAAAWQRLAAGQGVLDFSVTAASLRYRRGVAAGQAATA